jgi:hypothetical protein
MPRCGQFAEDRTEPSAGLMGLRGPHLPASRSATDEVGDTARADNWRNPEGVSALGHLSASLLSHSPFLGMLLRPSADVRLRDLTRDRAEFFNSLLEPVKKLQSAALLLDFWLGQGVRAVAIPAACCRCFASPCGLPSAGCLPRSAVAPGQRRPSQKDTQPCGREQDRPSGCVARSVTARCGDALSRSPCHTAFLALARRFLIFSQLLKGTSDLSATRRLPMANNLANPIGIRSAERLRWRRRCTFLSAFARESC